MDALLSPRRRAVLQALGAAAVVAACGDRRVASASASRTFTGPTMGSAYTLKIPSAGVGQAEAETAHDAVRDALGAIDAAMSTHRADSELSRFNRQRKDVPFALSPETFAVLALADRVSRDTDGAFDVTVGPVVDAWGFGPGRNYRVVGGDEIALLRPDVGAAMIRLDPSRGTAAKARDGVRADLSGIAKGYGVDKAAEALQARGIERYMIEAGGEVRTRGVNADGRPWQIAIEAPDAMPQRPYFVVPLAGLAMATSGDYRIFFEREGRRYCHEIDPATGAPIANALASVSVVAPDCGYADAMATALMVMGCERGLAYAQARDLAAYFIVREPGGRLSAHASPAFERLDGYLYT